MLQLIVDLHAFEECLSIRSVMLFAAFEVGKKFPFHSKILFCQLSLPNGNRKLIIRRIVNRVSLFSRM